MNKHYIDQETYKAFQEGHPTACKLIFYDVFEELVLRSFNIVKDRMEAEDIAIETFEKFRCIAAGIDTYSHFCGALCIAVRNRSVNYYHRQKGKTLSLDETPLFQPSEDTVSTSMLYSDVVKTIREEIERLKTKEKVLAELLVFQQLTPKKVAELLQMNEQTVRNIRATLRSRFKNALKKKGLPILILF